ncbi:MAG: class I SAM-dependent methyltransferase [Butyrivibrio sp.]|nr:class I SAM-dependent methyltransferase [Butyrivibrio sp.]
MDNAIENVEQARKSFNHILDNEKYAGIIKDDKHLALLLSLADNGAPNNILDIGTGTGYLAFPLAERFPTAKVCGIDIAETIVKKNNIIVKEKGISNLTFEVFDGLKYPFPDESFDLIVTRYAFHHFPNAKDAIRQMNRILTKDGRVLISDPIRDEKDKNKVIDNFMKVKKDGHIQLYSIDELNELFTDNGFIKESQVITDMKFPFARQDEYIQLYNKTDDKDKSLYDITNDNGTIWIKHINVGNFVFVKI